MNMRSPLAIGGLLLIAVTTGLAGGYTWYWHQLSDGLQEGLKVWLDQRRADGLLAEGGAVETDGFPFSIKASIASLTLGRGDKGETGYWRWQAQNINATLDPADPWHIRITTAAPVAGEFTDPSGTVRQLQATARSATGVVSVARTGRLTAIDTAFTTLTLTGSALAGPVQAEQLTARLKAGPPPTAANARNTEVDIQGNKLQLPANIDPMFGDTVDVFRLQATMSGQLPLAWSRPHITAWRNNGGSVDLTRARVKWGSLDLVAGGTVALDALMRPQGSGTATVRGHNESIRSLADRQLITPLNAAALTIGLNMMGRTENGAIKIPVSARDGRLKIGTVASTRLKPLQFPGD